MPTSFCSLWMTGKSKFPDFVLAQEQKKHLVILADQPILWVVPVQFCIASPSVADLRLTPLFRIIQTARRKNAPFRVPVGHRRQPNSNETVGGHVYHVLYSIVRTTRLSNCELSLKDPSPTRPLSQVESSAVSVGVAMSSTNTSTRPAMQRVRRTFCHSPLRVGSGSIS